MAGPFSDTSVFNQFTFFSVFIPGLYFLAVLSPIYPDMISGIDVLALVLVLLLSVAFVIGAFAHIGSEIMESLLAHIAPITSYSKLRNKINNFAISDRDKQPIFNYENQLVTITIRNDILGENSSVENEVIAELLENISHILPEKEEGEEYNRNEMGTLYQYLLAHTWDSTVVRTLHSFRLMCRSLLFLTILLIFITPIFVYLSNTIDGYQPVYLLVELDDITFLTIMLTFYTTLMAIFLYGYNRFNKYTIEYMIMNAVQEA